MKRFALGLAGVLLCVAPALAGEVWNVGTWKTAQTVQPFLYHEYAGDAEVTVHPSPTRRIRSPRCWREVWT